ncbi:MAG: AcrB/AcrD/AcrF family protein, partial [Acidobacteria bacterium]
MNRPESSYWFARHSKPLVFLILTIAALGGYLAFNIPLAVFPTTNFPRIVLAVDNGVMPIDQMMVTITRPVEEAVNSVPGLEEVRSTTSRGSAEIDLFFNWNVDMFQTLQYVNAAISRVQPELPSTAKIDTRRMTFASFPIIGYSLTSETVPQTRLWEMATYELKPRLNRLNGVATVMVQGGQEPEFHIEPDPAKLLTAGVTVTDILDAIKKTNLIDSPGLFEQNHQLVLGLISGQVHSPEQLAGVVVKITPAGIPVRVGDLANVVPAVKPVYTIVTANGKPAVLLNINRQPDSNTKEVADEAHQEVEKIRAITPAGIPVRVGDLANVVPAVKPVYTIVTANGKPAVLLNINRQPDSNTKEVADEAHQEVEKIRAMLPAGVKIEAFYDQSQLVTDSIASVRDAILIGVILASVILVVFLHDWGTSVVAGLVIPVTILVTFVVLKVLGESFDLMTLGGLAAAVGLVIDDAIVVVENIVLHRDAGQKRLEAIRNALREITVPLIGSTVTPVVVFLPLISITGVTGAFFRALAVTLGVSLFTSLALALTWTPTLSSYFIRKHEGESENADEQESFEKLLAAEEASLGSRFRKIIEFHQRWLRRALQKPWWLAGISVLLIASSYVCYQFSGNDLLPGMDEGDFTLDFWTPAGSSLSETNRMMLHIEQIINSVPEVESSSRRTGAELGPAAVTEANRGDILVKLKKNRRRNIDDVIEDVRAQVNMQEPAVKVEFVQLLQDMIGDLQGEREPVQIKLFSQNPTDAEEWAPKIAEAIKKIDGVTDVFDGVENTISGPAVSFQVDPAVAARAGFTPEEVATDAAALVEGEPAATPVISNDRVYTVRVRFPKSNRASVESVRDT